MKDHVESTAVNPEKLKLAKSVFIAKMDIHTFIISLSFESVAVKNARKWRKCVLLWIVHVLVCSVHQCGVSSEFYTRTAKSGNVSVNQNTISANLDRKIFVMFFYRSSKCVRMSASLPRMLLIYLCIGKTVLVMLSIKAQTQSKGCDDLLDPAT